MGGCVPKEAGKEGTPSQEAQVRPFPNIFFFWGGELSRIRVQVPRFSCIISSWEVDYTSQKENTEAQKGHVTLP